MTRTLLFAALFLGCFSGPENHASGTDQLKQAHFVPDQKSNSAPLQQTSSSPKGSPQTGLQRSSITIHPLAGEPITLEVELVQDMLVDDGHPWFTKVGVCPVRNWETCPVSRGDAALEGDVRDEKARHDGRDVRK